MKKELQHLLNERNKELKCLYALSRLIEEHDTSIEAVCRGITEILPEAFQFNDSARARLEFSGSVYASPEYKETPWKLNADITLSGTKKGTLSIVYLYEKPPADEGPFLREERRLIDIFAERLAKYISRKNTEQNLKILNERLELATKAGHMGVWDWDIENNRLAWDDRMYELYGVKRADFSGAYEAWLKGVHPEDMERCDQHVREALLGKIKYDIEFRIIRPDGDIRHIHAIGNVFMNSNGKAVRLLGLNYDITDQKKSTEALRASESKFRSLFQNAGVAMLRTSVTDGKIIDVNDKLLELYGCTKEELIGQSAAILWADLSEREKLLALIQKNGFVSNFEHRARDKSGRIIHCLSSIRIYKKSGILEGSIVDITEQKKHQEELSHTNKKYSEILASIPSGLFIYQYSTPESLILEYANPKADMLSGICSKDWLGREFNEIWPKAKENGITAKYLEVIKTGKNIELEDVYYQDERISGAFRIYAFNIPGNRLGVAFENITKIKKSEDALLKSEASYKALVEGLPDVIMRFDRHFRHLFVSENVNEVVDLKAGDFIGKNHRELGFPDNLSEMWEASIQRVFDSRSPYETEFSFSGKRGHTFMNWRLLPEFDSAGSVVSVLSISRDITREKLSEDRFRLFFSQISQLAYMISPSGLIIDINNAALERLGYTREELVGKPLKIIYAAESHQKMADLFQQWKKNGFIQNEEMTIITKSGEKRTVLLNVSAIRNAQGDIIHSVSLQTDITEIKKYQEEIQKTQKLESLGILAAGIAHDFNNMLNGIFGYIGLARDYMAIGEFEKVKFKLADSLNGIEQATALSNQLLTFAKGGEPLKKQVLLAQIIINSGNLSVSGSNAGCEYDIAEDLLPCECDKNQITQVLNNIVVNAKQSMPLGGKITIRAQNINLKPGESPHAEQGGFFIRISITDTGTGMPANIISHIFDPFFTTKASGHGLGLSVSYSIIKRHNGWIDVESEPGTGSTFSVYLPASASAEPEIKNTDISSAVMKDGTALVMDDEKQLREFYAECLELIGFRVAAADEGSAAVKLYREAFEKGSPFDMVILDLTVKYGLGGRDAAAQILEINPDAFLVVSSGYANDPIMSDPKAYGFRDCMVKPFLLDDLKKLVKRVCFKI